MTKKENDIPGGEHAPGAYPIHDQRPIGYYGSIARGSRGNPNLPRQQQQQQQQQQQRGNNSNNNGDDDDEEQQQQQNAVARPSNNHIPPEMRVVDIEEPPPPPQQDEGARQDTNSEGTEESNPFDAQFCQNTPLDASVRIAPNPANTNDSGQPSGHDKGGTLQQHRRLLLLSMVSFLILVTALVVTLAVVLPTASSSSASSKNNMDLDDTDTTTTDNGDASSNTEATLSPDEMGTLTDTFFDALYPLSGDALFESTTPQYQAFQWLTTEDWISMQSSLKSDEDVALLVQRYIMVLLYFSTNGPNWTESKRFLTSFGVCSWGQTDSDMEDIPQLRVDCRNEQGNLTSSIREIRIVGNNLQGNIPTEIASLSDLRSLEFIDAQLTGTTTTLLDHFGNLTHLERLTLSQIGLGGTLSTMLPESLQFLNVEQNRLGGNLPDEIGSLTNLQELRLAHNMFTGSIPETLANLDQLVLATFQRNNFTAGTTTLDEVFCNDINVAVTLSADCYEAMCSCCETCCEDTVDTSDSMFDSC